MSTSMRIRNAGFAALLSMSIPAIGQVGGGQGSGQSRPQAMEMQRPAPILMKGKLNEWIGAGTALYKVVSYESGLRDYRLKYNQGGHVIHPGFSKDRLAVVELEVRNTSDHPILPPVFIPALTDTDGVRTTEWRLDARQISFVTERPREMRQDSSRPAEIAAGQIMKLALIFSISPKARPTSLEFAPENYRDTAFGMGQGMRLGAPPATPAEGRIGPRGGGPIRPPVRVFHVFVDLTPPSKP